jgi:hypothetical protein
MVVVEEDDDDELPEMQTGTDSGHLNVPGGAQPHSVLLRSNNPLKKSGVSKGELNFDLNSKSSAFFTGNGEEVAEEMQLKVKEKWAEIEKRTEQLQQEYQAKLEQIIQDNTEEKFERLAEIKIMYKKADPNDEEAMADKKRELEEVKREMDELKEQ